MLLGLANLDTEEKDLIGWYRTCPGGGDGDGEDDVIECTFDWIVTVFFALLPILRLDSGVGYYEKEAKNRKDINVLDIETHKHSDEG